MRLVERHDARREQHQEIFRQCVGDHDERKAYHADLRSLYTLGSSDGSKAPYNKLTAHVRQSASYLFQSESVRLAPRFTTTRYGETWVRHLDVYRDEVHAWWHDSKAGQPVTIGVEWGHVYPSVVWKVVPSGGEPRVILVPDPADIGVLEADRDFDLQEALTHQFWMPLARFQRLVAGHPREAELMRLAMQHAQYGGDDLLQPAPAVERIAFDNVGEPLSGGGVPVAGSIAPMAHVETPRVPMGELWVVDDRIHDWRAVTGLAVGGELHPLFERKNPCVSGVDPFVKLTLQPAPDYTWGFSQVDDLGGLQDEYVDLKASVAKAIRLGLRPPIVLFGYGGLKDDRAQRLREENAVLAIANPNGKVERLVPQLPNDTMSYVGRVDREFADAGGLPLLLSGEQGEGGMRAGNQVGVLATLASARIRENAMRVEYAVSELATLGALMMRDLHDEPLALPTGERFYLHNIPRQIAFVVASHSASPLYAASVGDKADRALKAGAISKPSYVELLDLPMPDVLRAEARRLEEAAAKRSEQILEIQRMKAERRGR